MTMPRLLILALLLLIVMASGATAAVPAAPATGPRIALDPGDWTFLQTYRGSDGLELHYRLYTPKGYDAKQRYPLLLAMHGGPAQQLDLGKNVKSPGPGDWSFWASPEVQSEHPCFILYPFSPRDMPGMQNGISWHSAHYSAGTYDLPEKPTPGLRMVLELVDQAKLELPIDPEQCYVGGFSNGGYATWAMIMYRPELFKKAMPICGGGDPKMVSRIVNLPIWTAHGTDDSVVPIKGTRALVETLRAAGGKVPFSEMNCEHMWDWKDHISNRVE